MELDLLCMVYDLEDIQCLVLLTLDAAELTRKFFVRRMVNAADFDSLLVLNYPSMFRPYLTRL